MKAVADVPAPTTPGRILVVDDNRDNVEIVRQWLEARGYTVLVAYDGDEALERFEVGRPAVVLLDVMMPGRSGWDVCRVMKQHPEHGRNVRIIMLTALSAWHDKQQALQTGADDYITKPLDLQDLAARVQRNLALVAPTT
jgi:CheY-like chemotaxis protein